MPDNHWDLFDSDKLTNSCVQFDLAMDHLYGTCLASAKLGILALYYRVFVSAVFRKFVIGTAILIVLWWISLELIAMTYCFPFRKIWEVSMEEGWCMNFQAVGFYETIANLVLNLWIFFLPLHPIIHLQTTLRRKIVYGLLFSCGAGYGCPSPLTHFFSIMDISLTLDQNMCGQCFQN